MTTLAVVGAGGHGRVVAEAAALTGRWSAICFFDDRWPNLAQAGHWAVVGVPARLVEEPLRHADEVIVAIGDASARMSWTEAIRRAGYRLATIIHPSAVISVSASVGAGTVVCAGSVLNADCRVGDGVIVNTRAVIEHDCVVGDGAHICPGVQIAGGAAIGERAWIGIGSTVIQGCRIGSAATIGAGAVVVDDVPQGWVVAGVPAKQLVREK